MIAMRMFLGTASSRVSEASTNSDNAWVQSSSDDWQDNSQVPYNFTPSPSSPSLTTPLTSPSSFIITKITTIIIIIIHHLDSSPNCRRGSFTTRLSLLFNSSDNWDSEYVENSWTIFCLDGWQARDYDDHFGDLLGYGQDIINVKGCSCPWQLRHGRQYAKVEMVREGPKQWHCMNEHCKRPRRSKDSSLLLLSISLDLRHLEAKKEENCWKYLGVKECSYTATPSEARWRW